MGTSVLPAGKNILEFEEKAMEKIRNAIIAVMAMVGSFIANQLGGWDTALAVLIALMIADFVTGCLIAFVWHKSPKTDCGGLSSKEGFKGLLKKMTILIFVWMGVLLDRVIGIDYIRTTVILFYVANEGLSVIENTALMGVPYPAFVKTALEVMKDKNSNAEIVNP